MMTTIDINAFICEIHPILMLGVVSSLISTIRSSKSIAPKLLPISSMGKQSISIYSNGYNRSIRYHSKAHVLLFGHRPLKVETKISPIIGMDHQSHGGKSWLDL